MNDKARSLLEAARRELSRRKTRKAAKYLGQALEADPDSHELLAERAAMAVSPLRNYRSAVEDLTRAIGMAPDVGAYYDLRGQAYWYLREYERAFQDFNKAIELDPECASAYYHRGNFSEKLQRYESAIEDMAHAVELDPDNRNYKRRLQELKRAAVRYAQRLGEEPAEAAVEEPPPEEEGEEAAEVPVEQPAPPEPAAAEDVPPTPEAVETALPAEEQEAPPPEPAPLAEPEPMVAEAAIQEPEPEPERETVEASAEQPPEAEEALAAEAVAEPVAGRWSVRIPTGERFGPVSLAVLQLWAEEQRVKPDDELLGPDGEWVAAGSVPEIAAIFESLRTMRKPPVRPD